MKKPGMLISALIVPLAMAVQAQITVTQNISSIGVWDVYEINIQHDNSYPNNWEDVSVKALFAGPSQTMNIDGFFYDTNKWKVRFAPPQTGSWSWTLTFSRPAGTDTARGGFSCVASNTKGFLKKHPNNPFKLIYQDGTAYNGIGIGDCVMDWNNNGTLDEWGLDGDTRPPTPPDGALTDRETYMNAYGKNGAGFDLFRWSVNNCAFNLFDTLSTAGNKYLVREGLWGDTLVRSLRQNGFRIWITLFGGLTLPYPSLNVNRPLEAAAIKRYVRYVMARYGAFIDVWELTNEVSPIYDWISIVAAQVKSIDPYNRLVTIGYQNSYIPAVDIPTIGIYSPHWYEKESEFDSDRRSWEKIDSAKKYNKPVIFGEQGNRDRNWDPLSALRMRLRSWTAFFAEGTLIFWNLSACKDYITTAANLYLGPEERGYIRILQDFTALADSSTRQMVIAPSNGSSVRAYGLQSSGRIMGYFHHYNSHTSGVTTSFSLTLPQSGRLSWINPADGSIVGPVILNAGAQTLLSPLFTVDLAMRIDLGSAAIGDINTRSLENSLNLSPNPFNPITRISYSVPEKSQLNLRVYDSQGKLVKVLAGCVSAPGTHSVRWDGTNQAGRQMGSGVYLVRLKAGKLNKEMKVVFSK